MKCGIFFSLLVKKLCHLFSSVISFNRMRAKKNYLADKNLNNVAHKRELLSTFQTIASLFYAKEACKK